MQALLQSSTLTYLLVSLPFYLFSSGGLPTNGAPSSPDISLASAHLALSATWQPLIRLSSDHLPILIDPYGDHEPLQPSPRRLYSNFRKADWPAFTEHVERALSTRPPPASASAGERVFRETLRMASGKCVPRGHRRDFIPGTLWRG